MISRKILWILFLAIVFWEICISCVGQENDRTNQATNSPEIGIITDADGYTNVRSEPQISSKIIGRFNQNDFAYFIRSDGPWWKLTTRSGEGVLSDSPPRPEQNGYIHSSRIVPIEDLPILKIEGLYGQEWKKEKKEIKLGNIQISLFNADRIGYGDPEKIPESNSAYLEIRIPGKTPIRKYYPDIEGLGGAADIRHVSFPSVHDFRFFVKNGDYDGRTIIVAKDGRVADLDGGGIFIFKQFCISRTGTDCCGEPLIWDLKLWEKAYDLRDDKGIKITSEPEYSFHTALGNLYLKLETPYGPYDGDNTPQFFRLNKEGQFVRELNPPHVEERIKVLPQDLWQ